MSTYFLIFQQGLISYHDVDVEDSKPVKEHPYRLNPMKFQYLRGQICLAMTLSSLVKVIGVLVFLCQNRMEHFVCALAIEK